MSGGMNRHIWMNDVKKAGVYEDICLNYMEVQFYEGSCKNKGAVTL